MMGAVVGEAKEGVGRLPPMKRWWIATIACRLLALTAAWAGDDGPEIVFRLDMQDGRQPSGDDLRRAVDVLDARLTRAGVAECAITPIGNRISVKLSSEAAPRLETLSALLERPGTLEFRIEAEPSVELEQAQLRKAGGGTAAPEGYAWRPRKDGGEILVRTPEAPLAKALDTLRRAGVDEQSPEFVAARDKLEAARRDEVFTGDQLAKAEVRRLNTSLVVLFELLADRKEPFAAFTERHVGECMAIVLDGRVESAPVIRSKLPGAGVIEGGGDAGFTEREANDLALVLASGPLGGRLVRVPTPEVDALPPARVLAFRAVSPSSGGPLSLDAAKTAAAIVVKRCAHAGIEGVTSGLSTKGDAVEIRLPASALEREADVRRFVDRPGLIEFRIRAETIVEDQWRDRRLNAAEAPPEGLTWLVPEDGGPLQMLVEVPERPASTKVKALAKKDVAQDSAEMAAAVAEFERAKRETVFTNEQIASASVRRSLSTWGAQALMRVAVRFEFRPDRKDAFEQFTVDHVGRGLAVVVDGKVHCCPTLKFGLPGAGELTGSGAGYTEEQARELAAILESGPLPCRLVPETK
jgi:preprotein translocase subunit SecD